MTRILLASYEVPGWGGAATAAYALFRRLRSDGLDVRLVNLVGADDHARLLSLMGPSLGNPAALEGVATCVLSGPVFQKQPEVTDLVARLRPDVVYAVGYLAAHVLRDAAPALPLVFHTTGCQQVKNRLSRDCALDFTGLMDGIASGTIAPEILHRQEAQAFSAADLVVLHTNDMVRIVDAYFPAARVRVHSEVIWFADWLMDEARGHAAWSRPFAEREFDALFVASSWARPEKNAALVKRLAEQLPGLRLHVVGADPPAHPNLVAHGFVADNSELFKLFGNSRVVVCPSTFDAAPGVLFEASVMNCNLVASRNCGNWEMLDPRLRVDGNDEAVWASSVRAAVESRFPDRLDRFEKRASYGALRELLSVFAENSRTFRRRRRGRGGIAYHLWHYPILSETFIQREVAALRRSGVPVTIIAEDADETSPKCESGVRDDAAVVYLNEPSSRVSPRARKLMFRHPWRAWRAYRYVRRVRYHERKNPAFDRDTFVRSLELAAAIKAHDIAHVHAPWADRNAFIALVAARLAAISYSVQARAHDLHRASYRHGLVRKFESAAFVVTNTEYNAAELERLLGPAKRDRLHVIYNGIDRWRWLGLPKRRDGEGFRLLSVGRLIPQKGHHVLLEACALLRERGLDFELDIIGGPEIPRATEYAQTLLDMPGRLGLDGRVRFRGVQPWDMILAAYAAADLFVLPCVIDPDGSRDIIPNSLIEAMAAGLPVISTAITGIPEIVDHGTDGLLVPPNDAHALADAIVHLHGATDLRARLGGSAMQKVAWRFDNDRNCANRGALFRAVLDGGLA